jgi:ribonuclease T1
MNRNSLVLALVLLLLLGGIAACGDTGNASQSNGPAPATATLPLLRGADGAGALSTPVRTRRANRPTAIPGTASDYTTIAAADLPPEAQKTLSLIQAGGPFPHRQDGQVFQNREGLLPKQARGYYHEYTVETPGSSDRGARRIITGANDEFYYTDDHYASFKAIVFQ